MEESKNTGGYLLRDETQSPLFVVLKGSVCPFKHLLASLSLPTDNEKPRFYQRSIPKYVYVSAFHTGEKRLSEVESRDPKHVGSSSSVDPV